MVVGGLLYLGCYDRENPDERCSRLEDGYRELLSVGHGCVWWSACVE